MAADGQLGVVIREGNEFFQLVLSPGSTLCNRLAKALPLIEAVCIEATASSPKVRMQVAKITSRRVTPRSLQCLVTSFSILGVCVSNDFMVAISLKSQIPEFDIRC